MKLMSLMVLIVSSCSVSVMADGPTNIADAAEAQQWDSVKKLLAINADVNAAQVDGMTGLHWAVYYDDLEMTRVLLTAGADAKAQNRYEVTPLSLACINGNTFIVEELLKGGANPNTTQRGGETALMTAARTGNLNCIKLLLQKGANPLATERKGQSAILWAAAEGHADVVVELIQAGADPNQRLSSGFNPLFFAVRAGQTGVVDALLSHRVDVNQVLDSSVGGKAPRSGTAALLLAVENGHFELAIRLVEAGADPNDERSGFGALHALSWVRKPNRGDGDDGDPAPQGSGKIDSLEFVRQLVARGANVNQKLERGASGRGKLSRKGATPLMMAAVTADLPLIKTLVELGADPLIANAEKCTPFMAAAGIGSNNPDEEAGTEAEVLECLKFLLERGADVNTVDDNGETAMHAAAYKNLPKVVTFLAEHGARVDIWNRCNAYGWTPLSIATGTRVGNFKPEPEMMAALEAVLARAGVSPAKPTAAAVDIYEKPRTFKKPATTTAAQPQAEKSNEKTKSDTDLTAQLTSIVEAQAVSWNQGDIVAFMDAYWRDQRLTFSSGGKVTRGWESTRDRYLKNYPDKQTMGNLKFSDLEVQQLDDHAALMLGRWHLQRDKPIGGAFSLVWQKIDGKWVIIHDHSSSDAP